MNVIEEIHAMSRAELAAALREARTHPDLPSQQIEERRARAKAAAARLRVEA